MDHVLNGRDSGSHAAAWMAFFAAGACAGAAAALIFAPAAGTDTRAYLGRRGKELADDVAERGKKLWNEHGDTVTHAVQRGYEQAVGTMASRFNGETERDQTM